MVYTIQQKVWTVIWYGRNGSSTQVQREYRKKFGRRPDAPTVKTIKDWWQKIFETGSLNNRKKTMPKWVRTELKEEEAIARFREDEHASLRSVGREEAMPSPRTIEIFETF